MSSVNAREFVRQWYLLVVSQVQGTRQISRSAHYLEEARSLFPDDADILLASGSHHESLTFIGTEHHPVIDEAGRRIGNAQINPARERREAARWFRAAVDANPGLHEAAVRLGRTLHQLGDLQAAATTLETVRARAEDPPMKYLAALFLARVEEDRGRRARAADLYVEAIKAYPEAQAGFVGVSELLYVDAQPESAAKVMTNLLQKPAPSDPWWVYVMGEWWHYDARLRAMRNRVRQ